MRSPPLCKKQNLEYSQSKADFHTLGIWKYVITRKQEIFGNFQPLSPKSAVDVHQDGKSYKLISKEFGFHQVSSRANSSPLLPSLWVWLTKVIQVQGM